MKITAHDLRSLRRLLAACGVAGVDAPPAPSPVTARALPYDEAAELALPGRHRAPRHARPESRDNRLFPLAA
ncbi:hypothetical protein [Aeromicrobium sp. Leaf291]|uniref:hypothetical protein n=1 Tax=Aeromicrobium sp. Leaf291 TaxID=1736325 RepID=UPI0006FBA5C8|nr:hypothetical protein [Aeromicrobium sp. Leaf291]KQP81630.1 hypothetical protein ASF35_16495 [Aeromicrobium sp. Leaf291]